MQEVVIRLAVRRALAQRTTFGTGITLVPIAGVPGARAARVRLTTGSPWTVRVLDVDGQPVNIAPWTLNGPSDSSESNTGAFVVAPTGLVWEFATSDLAPHREYQDETLLVPVDIKVYPWVLHCECGRRRYSKRNSIHQITVCRVCHKEKRAKQKLATQRARRARMSASQPAKTSPTTGAEQH